MQIFSLENESPARPAIVFANEYGQIRPMQVINETAKTFTVKMGKDWQRRIIKGTAPRRATADFEAAKAGVIATLEGRLTWPLFSQINNEKGDLLQ